MLQVDSMVSAPASQKSTLRTVEQFAYEHLHDLKRRSGQSYAEHGIEVAGVLREAADDPMLQSVAILHDLLVHSDGEHLLRISPLSDQEKVLVQDMHELRRLHIDAKTKDLNTVLDAFSRHEELLPLRMAHRLNDVRHLDRFPAELRKEIAHESLHMYTAIAGRLGMHAWRYEMEDMCFRLLHPVIARNLQKKYDSSKQLDDTCLSQAEEFLVSVLRQRGIRSWTRSRIKGLYSTYRKMVLKKRRFAELTDRLAIRVVVPDVADCYKALGVIHEVMHPIPGKLKDYIGAPKENGYQSIHTVVYPLPAVTELPIEIQIRTEHMQELNEYGRLSHTGYKDALYALQTAQSRVNLFRNLEILRSESRSPQQFEDALRTYFSEDHVAVFSSTDQLYHLPKPATALDFVCHVFPKRSAKLKEVRINGRARPMDTVLKDGDIVQPAFAKSQQFEKAWLSACRHAGAKRVLQGGSS